MKTEHAPLFYALYGETEAKRVYQTLENLDPPLNKAVQTIAYNYFWELPGLSIRDKSLITLTTLFALGKEPQIQPHMLGFLNSGGTVEELLGTFIYLSQSNNRQLVISALAMLQDILQKMNITPLSISFIEEFQHALESKNHTAYPLGTRDRHFVQLAANVALCHTEKTTAIMRSFLANNCKEHDLRCLLMHQIVYCGFPTIINAFTLLKQVLIEK